MVMSKGDEKIRCCPRGQRQAAAVALRAACTGVGNKRIHIQKQSRFAQRLLARPQDGGGPEEILERDEAAIARQLRAAAGTRPGETVGPQVWSEDRTFPGSSFIAPEGPALETARS